MHTTTPSNPQTYEFQWSDADQLTRLEYSGPSDFERARYGWDAEGRLVSVWVGTFGGASTLTWMEHDEDGRPLRGEGKGENGAGDRWTWEEAWTYDANGRPIAHAYHGGESHWTWEDGRVIEDRDGTYAWDEAGRMIDRRRWNGGWYVHETWDWGDEGTLRQYSYDYDDGTSRAVTYEGDCPHVPHERFERDLDPTPTPYPQLPQRIDWQLLWPG